MAHDTRSRPRGGKKSLNLSANQELKKVLNLQIVATHYQASFPYLEGAVGATAGASLLTARACKQSWAWRAAAMALRTGPVMLVMKSQRRKGWVLCELQPLYTRSKPLVLFYDWSKVGEKVILSILIGSHIRLCFTTPIARRFLGEGGLEGGLFSAGARGVRLFARSSTF